MCRLLQELHNFVLVFEKTQKTKNVKNAIKNIKTTKNAIKNTKTTKNAKRVKFTFNLQMTTIGTQIATFYIEFVISASETFIFTFKSPNLFFEINFTSKCISLFSFRSSIWIVFSILGKNNKNEFLQLQQIN